MLRERAFSLLTFDRWAFGSVWAEFAVRIARLWDLDYGRQTCSCRVATPRTYLEINPGKSVEFLSDTTITQFFPKRLPFANRFPNRKGRRGSGCSDAARVVCARSAFLVRVRVVFLARHEA